VGNPGDEDEIFGIVHRADDAVIANSDAEVIPTGKWQPSVSLFFGEEVGPNGRRRVAVGLRPGDPLAGHA
jgi:hypothetical protein